MAAEDHTPELLSEHLKLYIEDSELEAPEDAGTKDFVEKLVRAATSSLEGFAVAESEELIAFWQRQPDHWKWAVDDYYSRRCIADLSSIVSRFLKLSPVLVGRVPSPEISTYLREATRCFLHGFFQGSIALSRAALECGVNDALVHQLGNLPVADLVDKIRHLERSGTLKQEFLDDAHFVRKAGGAVLHKAPAKEQAAYDALIRARRVLMRLYAG